ncbi:hypothetical protein T484DRAFT_1875799 [Baffinella frigidus]|nr:hypothetical protein T484DRAFT_1875799 [Cryptophyta sp. CCMP2293]
MADPGGSKVESVAWLMTAEEECALDRVGFAALEREVTRRVLGVVEEQFAHVPPGLQAAFHHLGDEWAVEHMPNATNEPTRLEPPFLPAKDRALVLEEVRAVLEESLEGVAADGPNAREFLQGVEMAVRSSLVRQFAAAQVYEGRAQLTSKVGESIGAALAMLWEMEPRIQQQHLARLKGAPIPAPLRRHVWASRLGGQPAVQLCAENLERARRRLGLEEYEESSMASTIFRVATELYSVKPALVASATPGSVTLCCAVLNRHHVLTGQRVRIERSVLILAPILHVFKQDAMGKGDQPFVRWLSLVVEVDKMMPLIDEIPEIAGRVLDEVRRDAPDLYGHMADLHQASGAKQTLAAILEPWLLTAMAGFLNMSTLLWWWDQLFVTSWDALPSACAGLLMLFSPNMLRCTDFHQLQDLVESRPFHFRPAALAGCFSRWTPPAVAVRPTTTASVLSRLSAKAMDLPGSGPAPCYGGFCSYAAVSGPARCYDGLCSLAAVRCVLRCLTG